MSKEAEYVYEKHMINAAKQQSLQEMVGITIIISVQYAHIILLYNKHMIVGGGVQQIIKGG